ncbi:hypothetical protein ACK3SF_01310 [Candidatus Nanosalina sp. VS9-1]|uniref:hypothetical protein n=1 Tax=Candidatus Nanosalina sp. VS9-1 TaxID=3388566 RepID=UPI0039E1A272
MNKRRNKGKDFFDEDETWKEKIEDKAQEVATDIEKKLHLTETEKNLDAFHSKRTGEDSPIWGSDSYGTSETDNRFEANSESDWKEEVDTPTFIVFSVEIILLTYFILAVLGYVPFF